MNILILLAAGSSKRAKQNKLQAHIHGLPLWKLTYTRFQNHPEIDQIVLVVPKGTEDEFKCEAKIVSGGKTRMQSFKNGLAALSLQDDDIVLDHNAANPSVSQQEITAVISAAKEHGAAAASLPAVDTIIQEENGFYSKTLSRENLRLMQTPQAVRADILKNLPLDEATDLTSTLLKHTKVKVIDASPANRKITFSEDLASLRAHSYIGEDSHRFSTDGTLTLGGLQVPALPKLEANSDGDVILHAIGRALAQAKNQSFSKLADELCAAGEQSSQAYIQPLLEDLTLSNVSIQVECKTPRIDDLPLTKSIAEILKLPIEKVTIAAMSGEGLTPSGRGEGISVKCILTITK